MPVKFKISEMFDNSCELFENEMQHKNIESEKRIKEIVFLEIGHTKAKRNRRRYIAVLAAAMGIGGITVGAHEVLKSAGEIKNNEEVVLENQNGLALYEKENSGAIQMEVETDIILPENLYKDGIPIIFWFMLLIYPILIAIQIFFNKKIMSQSRKVMGKMDVGNGLIKEFVSNLYEYLALNGRNYYIDKFCRNETSLRNEILKQNMLMAYNRSVPQLISTTTFLIVLAISGVMVIKGQVQFGELTVIIMYTQRMFNPLSSIMLVIGQFQKAKVSMDRINEIVG